MDLPVYTIKNVTNHYGVVFTNSSAKYDYQYNTTNHDGITSKDFEKPSVVVCAQATDDTAYANVGLPVTIDIANNDQYSKVAEDSYDVSGAQYVFFDATGDEVTADTDGVYTVEDGTFTFADGKVVFTANESAANKMYNSAMH